ncbi:MAG: FAD-dependent monooxygenase [Cyclobacteriaceae bacterium]|nr:FAD-dependent monooxygenase [Cyclobacteriaceae bacterium]
MVKEIKLSVKPAIGYDEEKLQHLVLKKAGVSVADSSAFIGRVKKRSIDARTSNIKVHIQAEVYEKTTAPPLLDYQLPQHSVANAHEVIIVGMGPAGLFAALQLIDLGIKPVIIERGKDVRARRRDLAAINKDHVVNPESNYCFGEGGAGTYSDGKLYTRSTKRGDINRILEIFVAHGAAEDILYEAHPHIGTNKLPKIIAAMRESILQSGGEIHFDTKVTDFITDSGKIKGVQFTDGTKRMASDVILATGHSARDIFELLYEKKIAIDFKPFALGVRIEHQQSLIDQLQYKQESRGEYLPPAAYSLVSQSYVGKEKRGVFSFCMCPGGFIVPAATAPGEIVVNGMSPSRRNSKYSNSGIVVAVEAEDLKAWHKAGVMAGLRFQQEVEQRVFAMGGGTQAAPAQLLTDFLNHKVSNHLNDTSYQPGLSSCDMHEVLPKFIGARLKQGFKQFGKKMKGYVTDEAQIVAVESRTSSPISIPRDSKSLEHPQLKGFYPCGEGAGYAGGIISAAMDGERVAKAIAKKIFRQ